MIITNSSSQELCIGYCFTAFDAVTKGVVEPAPSYICFAGFGALQSEGAELEACAAVFIVCESPKSENRRGINSSRTFIIGIVMAWGSHATLLVRILLFVIVLSACGSAQAAINYLVITPTPAGNYSTAFSLSISTACPAGYAIHYFGMNDVVNFNVNVDSGTTAYSYGAGTSYGSGVSTCVAGVPASMQITPSPVVPSSCSNAITSTVTLTAANSPQSLAFCVNPYSYGAGNQTVYTGRISLPDGLTIALTSRFYGTFLIGLRGLANGPQMLVYTSYGNGTLFYVDSGPALTQGTAGFGGSGWYSGVTGFGGTISTWTAPTQTFAYYVGF